MPLHGEESVTSKLLRNPTMPASIEELENALKELAIMRSRPRYEHDTYAERKRQQKLREYLQTRVRKMRNSR